METILKMQAMLTWATKPSVITAANEFRSKVDSIVKNSDCKKLKEAHETYRIYWPLPDDPICVDEITRTPVEERWGGN